ncbi:archemetzincin [Thermococci archaeon]|nr:MAG: archemetzincin [Thermococci archaeon]
MKIGLVPIVAKEVDEDVLNAIEDYIGRFYSNFGFEVEIIPKTSVEDLSFAYNSVRDQFLGRFFLMKAAEIRGIKGISVALGITDADLYEKGMNFIFGLANPYLSSAIISLARLRPEFYSEENEGLLKDRAIKEAMHELGHVFGLEHCSNPRCVMHFSNSIIDTDYKGNAYCKTCLEKLKRSLGWKDDRD